MSLTACRAASLFICKANPSPSLTAAIYICKWIHFPASPSRDRQRAEGAGRAAPTAPGARPSRAAPASRPVSIISGGNASVQEFSGGYHLIELNLSPVSLLPIPTAHMAEFEVREPKGNLFWRETQDSGMVSVSERAGVDKDRRNHGVGDRVSMKWPIRPHPHVLFGQKHSHQTLELLGSQCGN